MDLMMLVPDAVNAPGEFQRTPIIEHKCEVQKLQTQKDEFIRKLNLNTGTCSRIRQWIAGLFILSKKHPYTRTALKSTAAINYEINRHTKFYPYMMHPFSYFRTYWNIFLVIFTIIALFIVPVLNAYYFGMHEDWFPITLFIDIIFLSDIIITFFTGYYDFEIRAVMLEPKIVANNYLKSYFFLELLTIIPGEIVDFFINGRGNTQWYSPVFNFLKIIRLHNVLTAAENLKKTFQVSFRKHKIIEMIIIISITIHWSACLEYYVPKSVLRTENLEEHNNSWILSESMMKRDTRIKKYILCLHRATTALVSSAHILPVSAIEDMILNLILTVLGRLGFIYLLFQFLQISTVFHSSNKQHIKFIQQLQEFMHFKELPSDTQKRLLVYCDYYNKKHFDREKYILAQVTPYLHQELVMHRCKKLLDTVSLFRHLPQPVLAKVTECIRPKIYLTNDEIVKANTPGESLFYIVSGTVAVYSSKGKEICHLEDGYYFGEIALVMENETRIASVYAVETCEMYVLVRSDFLQAISGYPSLLNRLQKTALQRLEFMLMPGESNKEKISLPMSINISNIRGSKKLFS